MLDNSNLVSNDDYQSPSQLLKHKSYTKYLTKSVNKSPANSDNNMIITENHQLIDSVKIKKSPYKSQIQAKSRQVQGRYDSFKNRDSDSNEMLQ